MASDTVLLKCTSCGALNRVPVKRVSQNPLCGKCKTLLDFPFLPQSASAATFDKELASWPETVLVEFRSKASPLYAESDAAVADIAFSRAGRLKVLKIDLDSEPGLALLYSVQTSPTFLIFRESRQLGRLDGLPRDAAELAAWVAGYLQ